MLKPDKHGNIKIVFHKKVLSVLENINIGRNFLYQWIYSHHKVIYEQDLLQKIMETLIKRDTQLLDIFTIETFYEVKKICGCNYYLPSDDDIIFTMKNFFHEDVMISEYFSHNHKYRALWKTYFEFDKSYFRNVSGENRMGICARIEEGNLRNKYGNNSIKVIKAKPKLKSISQNDYFIDINNELIDASLATKQKKENLSYFIVYVVQDLLSRKEEIIHDILSLQS
jgi:HD superfamily phosphohydrolase